MCLSPFFTNLPTLTTLSESSSTSCEMVHYQFVMMHKCDCFLLLQALEQNCRAQSHAFHRSVSRIQICISKQASNRATLMHNTQRSRKHAHTSACTERTAPLLETPDFSEFMPAKSDSVLPKRDSCYHGQIQPRSTVRSVLGFILKQNAEINKK